jgi:hypothetical protein
MINNPVRALVFALAADGVPADKIFPLYVERAFRKLEQVNSTSRSGGRRATSPSSCCATARCI